LGSPLDSSENKDLVEMLGPFFRLNLYNCGIESHNFISMGPIWAQFMSTKTIELCLQLIFWIRTRVNPMAL